MNKNFFDNKTPLKCLHNYLDVFLNVNLIC